MQYNAQWTKPAPNKPQTCQNEGLSMLELKLKGLDKHAYMLGHKQGTMLNSQKALKE